MNGLDRRHWLGRALAGAGALALAGCDKLSKSQAVLNVLDSAETFNLKLQRLLLSHQPLAPEFAEADISPVFKANGSIDPDDPEYRRLAAGGFADWTLTVGGMVRRPLRLSLAELRKLPARTQITRHDCVEGWSCIGKWTGARLGPLLLQAGLLPGARYIVFRCADTLDGASYYESIGLQDAFHPQTLLAYEMNGRPLDIAHGAPLRLRLERQLGYKMAKYVMGIEAVDSFDHIAGGKGGYWEDRGDEWYAGI
jgi:DMSO/TMAO reductase YedYZ molybdopterin-dependent catalytic subunit